MPWFYNSDSGKLVHEDPPSLGYYTYEAALHTGTGWHELTVADSASFAQAQAAAKALNLGPVQGGNTSIGQLAQNETSNLPKQVAGGVLGSWNLTFGGFNGLLVRGLKILFGGILIIAGLIKLTGTDKTLQQVLPVVGGPAGKLLKV